MICAVIVSNRCLKDQRSSFALSKLSRRLTLATLFICGRDNQKEKIYVQNRITNNGKEIWEWLQNGAYFFICGDKQYMAKDVHKALINIAENALIYFNF